MQERIRVLLVTADPRRAPLLAMLEACGAEVLQASDREHARRLLDAHSPVQVVLTDEALPDGTWRSLVEDVARNGLGAEVVVCARTADATLWCDVLESGAYDLLVEPYEGLEVQRIVEAAAAKSYNRSQHKPS